MKMATSPTPSPGTNQNRCVYIYCNSHKARDKHISFFKFPIKNEKRTKLWQQNCGSVNIAIMDIESLRDYKICERHFAPDDFLINNKRKLLKQDSIPLEYVTKDLNDAFVVPINPEIIRYVKPMITRVKVIQSNCSDSNVQRNCSDSNVQSNCSDSNVQSNCSDSNVQSNCSDSNAQSSSSDSDVQSNCSDSSEVSNHITSQTYLPRNSVEKEMCECLTEKITYLKKRNKALYSQLYRLKKKKIKYSSVNVVNNLTKNKSEAVKTFVNMQLFHRKETQWLQTEKELALSLYDKSPSSYKFMITNFKLCLPSIRIIQFWKQNIKLKDEEEMAASLTSEVDIKDEPCELDIEDEPSELDIKDEPSELDVKDEPSELDIKEEPSELDIKDEPSELDIKDEPRELDIKVESSELDIKDEPISDSESLEN